MPQFLITAPDGKKYRVTGPSKDGALQALKKQLGAKPGAQSVASGKADRELSWAETPMDIAKGFGSGLVRGAASLVGGLGDVQQMGGDVAGWAAGKLGAGPDVQGWAKEIGRRVSVPGIAGQLPRTQQVQQTVEAATGPMYEPRGFLGQTAEKVGEFAPSAALGPGGAVRKTALAVAPAVAAEAAGRLPGVAGSEYQPYVETGAALAAGLPIAAKSDAGKVMANMRKDAPGFDTVRADRKQAYKTVDSAGIVYDTNAFKGAAMRLKSELHKKGYEPLAGGQIKPLVTRVDDLLKPKKVASWTKIEGILKDAKKIMRGNADDTTKMQAGIIVQQLENLQKNGKMTSRAKLGRDEINATIDNARELARREILAKDIAKMKRKLPGYLVGDEGGARNQFGSYLKSDKGANLTPAEQEAFAKVVRREGPLNAAHMAGSRLGNIVTGNTAGGIGGYVGSAFGPVGAAVGYFGGKAAGVGSSIAFRKIMDKVAEKAVDDALKTVLAGRAKQGKAISEAEKEKLKALIRSALISGEAVRQQEPFLTDARGTSYTANGQLAK